MAEPRELQFQALLADAQDDPDVLGVFLFGSRSREGLADERSDYDVGAVVADREGALAAGAGAGGEPNAAALQRLPAPNSMIVLVEVTV